MVDVFDEFKNLHRTFHVCDWPGCTNSGDYQAPKSRHNIHEYQRFCLNHVREYNAKWNYYAGMSENEILHHNRKDLLWERPTWPFGTGARSAQDAFAHMLNNGKIHDPFELFEDERKATAAKVLHPNPKIAKALQVFNLKLPLSQAILKKTYKKLVKEHHPDAHQGSADKVEKIKEINTAYQTLKDFIQEDA